MQAGRKSRLNLISPEAAQSMMARVMALAWFDLFFSGVGYSSELSGQFLPAGI